MGSKRKRATRVQDDPLLSAKRQKQVPAVLDAGRSIKRSLLLSFYPTVLSLREYLIAHLPRASKARRKKILGLSELRHRTGNPQSCADVFDASLASYLDSTLIGVETVTTSRQERQKRLHNYSQQMNSTESTILSCTSVVGMDQSELVDFCIWLLFSENQKVRATQKHLLCQGYRKSPLHQFVSRNKSSVSSIQGLSLAHDNEHVAELKAEQWTRIRRLLGKEGEAIMIDLIMDCGIFVAISGGENNHNQISGIPLGDLPPCNVNQCRPAKTALLKTASLIAPQLSTDTNQPSTKFERRSPSSIVFVRNRMLYAKATLNSNGDLRFGLRHIHALNRFKSRSNGSLTDPQVLTASKSRETNALAIAMYIFPSQFGLHNVFTSHVNRRETVQPFKDYTTREEEFLTAFEKDSRTGCVNIKTPKRLRGLAMILLTKLLSLQSKIPYKMLLLKYCGTHSRDLAILGATEYSQHEGHIWSNLKTQQSLSTYVRTPDSVVTGSPRARRDRKPSFLDHATPVADVSAFCRTVLRKMIPIEFWGVGQNQKNNQEHFLRQVDVFVRLRRFETLSLHQVAQGIKLNNVAWLATDNAVSARSSISDTRKRMEIFLEFIYYLFDSILIPLIRAHFHVTESNSHRYRLFYFRHDIWRAHVEPALTAMKGTMFTELNINVAQEILRHRTLGFSQVRLLPKESGLRPIMNLRRRPLMKGSNKILGSSINSLLTPVFNVLICEKEHMPHRLGSSMFSVGDIHSRLKRFLSRLNSRDQPLFFAKVDVQSAFDTIPQSEIVKLMSTIPQQTHYRIMKHLEIKAQEAGVSAQPFQQVRPIRNWASIASPLADQASFSERLASVGKARRNTIFVNNVQQHYRASRELLDLLSEHVQNNVVKIGKKYFRQKEGIPQGSVISSLLCNYFYADFESRHLGFLQEGTCLLLRLIDDFLLITTDQHAARRFLQVMHDGMPSHGIVVNPSKTLTNFEVNINGQKVPRLVGSRLFPYCGTFIDTKTFNMTKDRDRRKKMSMSDSLTVEYSRTPGRSFHRKVLNSFKIQAHSMFMDTSFNAKRTVLRSLYDFFVESATKMWTYSNCLPKSSRPRADLVIRTISDLIVLAVVLIKSKSKNPKNADLGYRCSVAKIQVEILATSAFRVVLGRKQSQYQEVIKWLDEKQLNLSAKNCKDTEMIKRACLKDDINPF